VHTTLRSIADKMFKPIIRMGLAVLVSGGIALAITLAPAANGAEAQKDHDEPFAKADRLVVPVKGTACSRHGWPNFEPKCQFDLRETSSAARTVRVIALR
jgi:hypothetical protein